VLINGICHRARCIAFCVLCFTPAPSGLCFGLCFTPSVRYVNVPAHAHAHNTRRWYTFIPPFQLLFLFLSLVLPGFLSLSPSLPLPPPLSLSLSLFPAVCPPLITSPFVDALSPIFFCSTRRGFTPRRRIAGFPRRIPFTCYLIPYSLSELCRCSLVRDPPSPRYDVIPGFSSPDCLTGMRFVVRTAERTRRIQA